MLHVGRLKVLSEVVGRGSFSAAAEALSYTQSAISQAIARLEAETGTMLVVRDRQGIRPTAAGATLVEHAEAIFAQIDAAETDLAAVLGVRIGRLRMASFPSAGATLMPLAIATFREAHPDVSLTLAEGEPEEIAPRLHAGEFDLTLLFEFSEPEEAPQSAGASERERAEGEPGGRRVELLEDPMYLALPREHPLTRRRSLKLEDLHEQAWVQTSAASPCARYVVRCCHAAGFEPEVAFESDDYQTVQGLVAAGVGVALIPELALSTVREDVVVRALAPHPPGRRVIAALPGGPGRRTRLIPAASAMLRLLEEAAADRERPLGGRRPD